MLKIELDHIIACRTKKKKKNSAWSSLLSGVLRPTEENLTSALLLYSHEGAILMRARFQQSLFITQPSSRNLSCLFSVLIGS